MDDVLQAAFEENMLGSVTTYFDEEENSQTGEMTPDPGQADLF